MIVAWPLDAMKDRRHRYCSILEEEAEIDL